MKKIVVFDLDGTVVDNGHRYIYHFVDMRKYLSLADKDETFEAMGQICKWYLNRTDVITVFLTARMEIERKSTLAYIRRDLKHDFPDNRLYMKPNNLTEEKMDTPRWKLQTLLKLVKGDKNRIMCVFEDRSDIVDLMRSVGIVVIQP